MRKLILNDTFASLKLLNKYLAIFLLLVFSWAVLPSHTIHGLFADHEDTDHEHCNSHFHSGTSVEKKHTHCEILKTNTPVYNSPSFVIFEKIEAVFISEINTRYSSSHCNQNFLSIPARGPPTV